jgi:nucleoside-diphosphate-sugar epimerase
MLIASTSEVYDRRSPAGGEVFRQREPVGPRATTKTQALPEAITTWPITTTAWKRASVRIFNTSAPRAPQRRPRAAGVPLTGLRGENDRVRRRQTRSFCYVDDLIEHLQICCSATIHMPVNIIRSRLRSLVRASPGLSSSPPTIFAENDPMKRRPDITKAKGNPGLRLGEPCRRSGSARWSTSRSTWKGDGRQVR